MTTKRARRTRAPMTTFEPAPARPRLCFYVPHQDPAEHGGFVPSVVHEGEPGHSPMTGNPLKLQTPWVWGQTLEAARAVAVEMNARLGLSEEEAAVIVASSMGARR